MDLNFDLNLSNLGAQPDFYEVMAEVTAHPKIQLHLGTGRANIEKPRPFFLICLITKIDEN